ncbi:MAG: hypothetical protein EBZ47_10125 [Chlamydiae bacterium]|jgi:hypothetical protein|nr:hypothetical protein [Chlamydiota bacterium]
MTKEKKVGSKLKANDNSQELNKLLNSAVNNAGNELVEQKSDKPVLVKNEKSKEQKIKELLDAMGEALTANSGGLSDKFGWMVYDQLSKSCYKDTNIFEAVKHICIELKGIAPKDQIEGMLATQMIATHHAALDDFAIAAQSETMDIRAAALSSATKLTRTYAAQMEALNRYRGKGQQKMTVEHVHINSNVQAIIGNITKNNSSQKEGGLIGGILKNEQ